MMGNHQRPGCERHEFPCYQKAEGVICKDDQVHPGEICRIERKYPLRRLFVLTVAKREQTRGRPTQIDDNDEEG